ncbi:MAG: VanW family protein [Dehalococcoidia bacterium]|nr:VanW family protein [Dehalococcoidia bacterium]
MSLAKDNPTFARTSLVALIFIAGFLLLLGIAVLTSYQIVYGQRIPLGVQLQDIDVGGLKPADAESIVSANLDAYLRTPLVLRANGRELKALPGELGASFNVGESIAQGFSMGQGGGIIDRITRQLSFLQHPQRLDLAFVFNDDVFQTGLARLAKEIEQTPQNANIKLLNGEVALIPERAGYYIDRAALRKHLEEAMAGLSSAAVEIPLLPSEAQVKAEDLAQAKKQIEGLISGPVTVKYGDRQWAIDRTTLSGMINIQPARDANGVVTAKATIEPDKAEAWAEGIARDVDRALQDARIAWSGGNMTILSRGQDGITVDTAKFGAILDRALARGERVVDLPVLVKPAAGTSDISRLGIRDRIAEASTSYAGTLPDRIQNVQLGAGRINGKIIPPGGVYSMAEALGEISEASGYKLGLAIVGQDTVLDVGGGLSQLTTTVFKAAVDAGFPIVQYTSHYYRIRRYEPILGLEATIYPPAVDMKFRNDTDNYVLLEARTDAGRVYITFYGTRPNREVSYEGPIIENVVPTDRTVIYEESPLLPKGQQITSEVAEDGMDVTVYRLIKVGGKEVRRDRFFARFRPAHNVIMVGTKIRQ